MCHKPMIRIGLRAFSFNSADIPKASGCLICPVFTRTAQLVQQPADENLKKQSALENYNEKMSPT